MIKGDFIAFVNEKPRKYVCGADSIEFLHVDHSGYVKVKHIGWQRNSMYGTDPLYGLGEFEKARSYLSPEEYYDKNIIVFRDDDYAWQEYLAIYVNSKCNITIVFDNIKEGPRVGRIFALVE